MGIKQSPLPKHQMSLIILQEVCGLVVSLFHHPQPSAKMLITASCVTQPIAKFSLDGMFTSPTPHDVMVFCSCQQDGSYLNEFPTFSALRTEAADQADAEGVGHETPG